MNYYFYLGAVLYDVLYTFSQLQHIQIKEVTVMSHLCCLC